MIDRQRWQRVSTLLDEALAMPAEQRPTWLQALAEREPALAADVAQALGTTHTVGVEQQFEQWLAPALADEPAAVDLAGTRLGAWRLQRRIGQGGMGEVWLARRDDGLYEAETAIKLLRSDLTAARLSARFDRERAVLARLNHPAIARLLNAGVQDGRAYLVLELVKGQALADHARLHCPRVAERVQLLLQIAQAVAHAHSRLIVHRDLKPSNVLVQDDGQVKLLDFGIAGLLDDDGDDGELTRQTGRGLTLGYAAPEQVLGAPIGAAADVFSLGVMLFELLGGTLPLGRRNEPRRAIERAVLHDEPRRLAALGAAEVDPGGPGRPQDAARAFGDLEAIAAKALRREPAERYGSVQAMIEDLQRWQRQEPVSVRRDDWRHRSGLFMRRHALLAGATATVTLALLAGLATSLWQWQRAEAAARQSDRVTDVLADLLSSASPERHGGQWPTVLQLLETSVAELPERLRDEPDTHLRLLGVMADTYTNLNRFDRALPLLQRWVEMADAQGGPQSRPALLARLHLGRAHQVLQNNNLALATLEPLGPQIRQAFGEVSPEMRQLQHSLAAAAMHAGRFELAEQALAEGWRITRQLPVDQAHEQALYLNNLHVLRNRQGRVPEALALARQAQPFWASTDATHARTILTLRRNPLDTEIDLMQVSDAEPRMRAIVADMDRLLGPGNEQALLMYRMLARYFAHSGEFRRAAAEYDALLAHAARDGVAGSTMLRPRAERVLMQARAGAGLGPLKAETEALLREIAAEPQPLAGTLLDALMALAEFGLLLDDAQLASRALAVAGSTRPPPATPPGTRWARIEGELARLQGDLPTSRARLQQRIDFLARNTEQRVIWTWSAQLNMAYTLVLMGSPEATARLQHARSLRPPALAPGHPLDAVADYLQARLAHGSDDAAPVRSALKALAQAQQRPPERAQRPGLASLSGAFF